jgi:GNAT superfamily N-acetyltransferase
MAVNIKLSPEEDCSMAVGSESDLLIRPFGWEDWRALWQLRFSQLAEHGILGGELPAQPDLRSPYERDYHRMGQVYLAGAGNFWVAWLDNRPVGHVGAQDIGGAVELRRMYVVAESRRRGVGARLVATLIEHCLRSGVKAIELWTSEQGSGRFLYEKCGFRIVARPGPEFQRVALVEDEIRMRLDLRHNVSSSGQ